MMDECDPLLLQRNNYVVHHYFSDIYDPKILTMPRVPGFNIVKVYDDDPGNARDFSETFLGKPMVCETLEEMAEELQP
jgi:hypothetical protein